MLIASFPRLCVRVCCDRRLRQKMARELYIAKTSLAPGVLEAARRRTRQQVEQHVQKVKQQREKELVRTYGRTVAAAAQRARPRSPQKQQEQAKAQLKQQQQQQRNRRRRDDAERPPAMKLELTDELLGEGVTGKVWAARFGPTSTMVAAKIVEKGALGAEQLQWIRDEIAIHRQLRHPHVCTLHGAIESPATITMVLSLCRGGTLTDTMGRALEQQKPLSEAKVHSAFVQLCGALHYCHRIGVVHRDIKLDNLCWTDGDERMLQLIDFGYAATANEQSNFAGSPHYAAPEVHHADAANGDGADGHFLAAGADVWSAGVCLFAMLATQLPFNGGEDTDEERAALRAKVCAGAWDVTPPDRSEAAVDLVTRMLAVAPDERCSLDEVCDHEWVGGIDAVPWQALPE